MSRGEKRKSLFDLSKESLRAEDHPALHRELLTGTDRSAALVGCAAVEAALLTAISSHLIFQNTDDFEKLFFSQIRLPRLAPSRGVSVLERL